MKNLMSILAAVLLLAACTQSPGDITPTVGTPKVPNKTISQLKNMYTNGAYTITDSIVIAGRVISSDQEGNFYRSFYIQDASGAMEIKIGTTGLYNFYPVGSWVSIDVKGMTLGNYPKGSTNKNTVALGAADPTGEYENSYIDVKSWIKKTFICGAANRLLIDTLSIGSNVIENDAKIGNLIRLNATLGAPNFPTWARYPLPTGYVAGASDYGQQSVTPIGFTLPSGTTMIIRTSPYAKFAKDSAYVAGKTVRITGILTKFNSTYQIVLNTNKDVIELEDL